MQIITNINEMTKYSRKAKQEGKTIGFVPTMGFLHEGHLSLVRAARKECDVLVMSNFVNPTQFCPGEDLDKYPVDKEKDRRLAEKEGVDVIFEPLADDIYGAGYSTYVNVEGTVTNGLCGKSRSGHFRGVTTVVCKLLNIVAPDRIYFGQKDAQQAVVVKQMVKDLNMPVLISVMPVIREQDGLAMSSRNTYLSADERTQALSLIRSLKRAEEMTAKGECSAGRIKEEMAKILQQGKDVRIDYIEIVDSGNLEPVETVKENTLVAVAAFVGTTRLIDNIVI